MYVAAAGATALLLVAAALTASGIDTPRPRATDLPVLIARSDPKPATSSVAGAIAGVPSGAVTAAPASAAAPAPAAGGTASKSSKGSSVRPPAAQAPAAQPPAVAPPAPSRDHDHEVVVPPVREDNEHKTAPVPEIRIPTPVPVPHD